MAACKPSSAECLDGFFCKLLRTPFPHSSVHNGNDLLGNSHRPLVGGIMPIVGQANPPAPTRRGGRRKRYIYAPLRLVAELDRPRDKERKGDHPASRGGRRA